MLDTAMSSAQNGSSSYDSELKCPKCFARATNDLNSIFAPQQQSNTVKFVYSTKCPHYLCINCKNELYRSATSQNKQLKCFSCQMFLKSQDYTEQSQEEYLFDKDLQKRQAIMKIYNKKRQDFATAQEYNAYLEDVEDKIQKLIDGEDVELIQRQIKEYMNRNRQQIAVANLKKQEQLNFFNLYKTQIFIEKLMIKAENQKLNSYGYNQQDSMDQLTQERVSKLLQGFKLDDLDKLGETQNQVVAESEFQDSSQRFVEPYIYALYRTDMPRQIEQTHIPSNNTLAQIIASSGLIRKSQVENLSATFKTDVPQNYKMMDLHKQKASKLFRSGLF